MPQPNNILFSLENIYPLSGSNSTTYFYEDGKLYLDGQENIPEAKQVDLSAEQINKTTRIKSRTSLTGSAGVYTTHEGIEIPYQPFDEIYVSHNYVDDDNIDRDYNSSTVRNSWWYDVKRHRSYKVYLRLRYFNSFVIAGVTYYDWRVTNSYVAYKDATANTSDGVYKFTTLPPNDINFTASVRVEAPRGFITWEKAALNVYKNNTLYTSSYIVAPNTQNGRITNEFIISASSVVLDDEWKMSVEVDGNTGDVQDPLQVPEYTMSFNTVEPPSTPSFLGFVTPDDINNFSECQPTLNNAIESRKSLFLQDVDYSTGVNTPQNIGLIVGDKAVKAATPDSNYSQYSHTLIRYYGVKTTRTAVNTGSVEVANPFLTGSNPYTFATDNLGAIPNVELLNYYVGFFNRVVDPYPTLNNKTAYFVQYLVDSNEDLFDPSVDEKNLLNLQSTFKISDLDKKPTKAKVSVITKNDADELKELEEGFHEVFKTGFFPTPIFYSQNSSINYTSSVTLFDGTTRVKSTPITSTIGYWEFMPGTSKEIYLVDDNLNNAYGGSYLMEDQIYYTSSNKDFPFSIEPEYTKFPPVTKTFNFEAGDEIRFENDESKVFRFENVRQEVIGGNTKVVVTLNKDLVGENKNFFLVRRFLPISNYVILNQQKPYSIPVEPNSTLGLLSPEFKIPELSVSADSIASTLTQEQNQEVIVNNTINIPETDVDVQVTTPVTVNVPSEPTPPPPPTPDPSYYTLTKCSDGSTGYISQRTTDSFFLSNNDRVVDTSNETYTVSGTTTDITSGTAIRINPTGQTGCTDSDPNPPGPEPDPSVYYSLLRCSDSTSGYTSAQTTDTISLSNGDRVTAGGENYTVIGTTETANSIGNVTATGETGCPPPPPTGEILRLELIPIPSQPPNGLSATLRYFDANRDAQRETIYASQLPLEVCIDPDATGYANGAYEIDYEFRANWRANPRLTGRSCT